jgi:hypothetical protein
MHITVPTNWYTATPMWLRETTECSENLNIGLKDLENNQKTEIQLKLNFFLTALSDSMITNTESKKI